MAEATKDIAKKEESLSVRFMNKVVTEFGSNVGSVELTLFQRRLAQNYFMAADNALKLAETKRLKKPDKDRDPVPCTWQNVNMEALARDVVSCARIGLDPAQRNHVSMVLFKNNVIGKYDIGFIEGYRGLEIKATKYGLDIPDQVIVELVYSKDRFKSIKRDRANNVESYEFEIVNDFDRGEIVGGFYYHCYHKAPEKNRLVVMTLKDILKRKPRYASYEFWGGEKDIYENGKRTGKKEEVEGWYEKMCWKTIYRAAYASITIDSQKIDDDFLRLKSHEDRANEAAIDAEITDNANTGPIVDVDTVEDETPKASTGGAPPAETIPENGTAGSEAVNGTHGPGW